MVNNIKEILVTFYVSLFHACNYYKLYVAFTFYI